MYIDQVRLGPRVPPNVSYFCTFLFLIRWHGHWKLVLTQRHVHVYIYTSPPYSDYGFERRSASWYFPHRFHFPLLPKIVLLGYSISCVFFFVSIARCFSMSSSPTHLFFQRVYVKRHTFLGVLSLLLLFKNRMIISTYSCPSFFDFRVRGSPFSSPCFSAPFIHCLLSLFILIFSAHRRAKSYRDTKFDFECNVCHRLTWSKSTSLYFFL